MMIHNATKRWWSVGPRWDSWLDKVRAKAVAGDGAVLSKLQPTVAVSRSPRASWRYGRPASRSGGDLVSKSSAAHCKERTRICGDAISRGAETNSLLLVSGIGSRWVWWSLAQSVVTAWQRAEPTWTSFITNPYGCAWHVDRGRFDTWLVSQAEAMPALLW